MQKPASISTMVESLVVHVEHFLEDQSRPSTLKYFNARVRVTARSSQNPGKNARAAGKFNLFEQTYISIVTFSSKIQEMLGVWYEANLGVI